MMKEYQDLSTQVYERSPTRDKLKCGCKVNAQASIDSFVSVRTAQARTWVHQVARAMVEQLREDKHELKTRAQKKKAKGAEYAGLFMKTTKTKEQVMCQVKWGGSCTTTSKNCSACGKGGIGMKTTAGGLTLSCAPR